MSFDTGLETEEGAEEGGPVPGQGYLDALNQESSGASSAGGEPQTVVSEDRPARRSRGGGSRSGSRGGSRGGGTTRKGRGRGRSGDSGLKSL